MRFDTGVHPRQWHRGAWVLALLIAALMLVLTHRPSGGRAFAMEPDPVPPPPSEASPPSGQETAVPPDDAVKVPPVEYPNGSPSGAKGPHGSGYVAEIVDSSYTVGPAEFFALDLPTTQAGAKAVHLFGTVTTKGKKDIVVRLFRAADYDRWLKQKGGRKPEAFWTSPRSGNLTLDQDLPVGEPVVLLLDNGYSIRTSKSVSCQLQLRYQRNGTETFDTEGGGTAGSGSSIAKPESTEDNLPTPRANTDEEMPAPPPPPPSGY